MLHFYIGWLEQKGQFLTGTRHKVEASRFQELVFLLLKRTGHAVKVVHSLFALVKEVVN